MVTRVLRLTKANEEAVSLPKEKTSRLDRCEPQTTEDEGLAGRR